MASEEELLMSGSRIVLCLLAVLMGCGGNPLGSEADARKHFAAEMTKWMAGQQSQVKTIDGIGKVFPVRYDIRSVLPDEPDLFAHAEGKDISPNSKSFPAYRFNVAIEQKSERGTPLETLATYTVTFNTDEQRWYARERH